MRDILYRAKRVDNGEWVEGSLMIDKVVDMCLIYPFEEYFPGVLSYVVLPSTVGQYTGLTDKNGKKIFEHDIVRLYVCRNADKGEVIGKVEFKKASFIFDYKYDFTILGNFSRYVTDIEVIGNLIDNPELLQEDAQ